MRVAVLEHDQELHESARHWLRPNYASQLVELRLALWVIKGRMLKVVVKKTFQQLLAWLRPIKVKGIPQLLPAGIQENFDLYYPARYQATCLRQHEGFASACERARG